MYFFSSRFMCPIYSLSNTGQVDNAGGTKIQLQVAFACASCLAAHL